MEACCVPSVPAGTGGNSPAIHRWETDRPRLSSKSRRDGRTSHRRRGEKRFPAVLTGLERGGKRLLPSDESLGYYRPSLRDSTNRPSLHKRRRAPDFGPLLVLGCTKTPRRHDTKSSWCLGVLVVRCFALRPPASLRLTWICYEPSVSPQTFTDLGLTVAPAKRI